MDSNSLRELDEPGAALRMLVELSKAPQRFSVGELCVAMSALGVGRTAVDSSRRALVGAGLAQEDKEKGSRNRTFMVLSITSRGMKVASKLGEIQALMSRVP
jgi:DNA-binding transcriptional regulator GbsR (MarR family)